MVDIRTRNPRATQTSLKVFCLQHEREDYIDEFTRIVNGERFSMVCWECIVVDSHIVKELKKNIQELEAQLKEQKRLNQSLTESQNIQKTMLERSLVGFYISLQGKYRAINPIAVSYTGYHTREIIGKASNFMVHPDDKVEVSRNARIMLRGEPIPPYEFRIITKQKKVRWVMEAVAPILFEGKPAILGNTMDISERKIREHRLIESENLYRAIFETTGTMTTISEEDKTISLVNSEFEKVTGYRKEDWERKRKWTEIIEKGDLARMQEYHRLRRIDADSMPRTYEYHLIDARGRIRTVLNTVSIIPGSKKNVSSGVDITELKEKENELIVKSRNLEELNAALKVLLRQREEDKAELEKTLLSNLKELVLPYIEKIRKSGLDPRTLLYVDLLESNLENIVAPFSRKLSARYMHLTPKEVQVAQLVKDGKRSKEIASILNVSSSAIDIYRYGFDPSSA